MIAINIGKCSGFSIKFKRSKSKDSPSDKGLIGLDYDELQKGKTFVDEKLMADVFKIIDRYLSGQTDSDDLDTNFDLIHTVIRKEKELGRSKERSAEFRKRKSSPVRRFPFAQSNESGISPKDVMTALLRLLDLKNVKETQYECSNSNTLKIAEVNRIAMDTITRRLCNQTDLLPRIDNMIFDIALQRAKHCLVDYRATIERISSMPQFKQLTYMWDNLLTKRMRRERFADNATNAFLEHPRESMEFVAAMPNVVEQDLIDIILSLFVANFKQSDPVYESAGAMSEYIYNRFLRMPCDSYTDKTSPIFQTYEFDVRLIDFMPVEIKAMDRKHFLIGLQRSYYLLCKKALHEDVRFALVLRQCCLPSH